MRVVITTAAFALEAEIGAFARPGEAGALASFTGYCRADGGAVERLELEHYPGFTEAEIGRLGQAVAQRYALLDLLIIHRVGAIPVGDAIVLVAALSAHRAPAFAAVAAMMDYLKTDAPIWKKAIGRGGARWIEPSAEDRARRASHEPEEASS